MPRFREIKNNPYEHVERDRAEEQKEEMLRRQHEHAARGERLDGRNAISNDAPGVEHANAAARDQQARVEQEMRDTAAREGASHDGEDSLAEDAQERLDTLREEVSEPAVGDSDPLVEEEPEIPERADMNDPFDRLMHDYFQREREQMTADPAHQKRMDDLMKRVQQRIEQLEREKNMPTRNADPEPEKEPVRDEPPTTNRQKEEPPKEPGKSDGMPGVNQNPQPPKENVPTANPAREPNKDGMPTTRVGGEERSSTSTSTRTGMPNTAPDFETIVQKTGGNRSVATDAYGRAAEAATKPVQTITKEQVSEQKGINIIKAGQIGGVEKMGEVMRAAETFSPDKAVVVTGTAAGNLYVAFKGAEELDKLIPKEREVSSFGPSYHVVKFELTEHGKEEAAKFVGGIDREYAAKKLVIADKESTMDKLLSTAKMAPRGHLVYLQGAEADISAVDPKEVIERARKEHGVDAVLIEKGENGSYKAYVSEELAADFDGSRHSGVFTSETEVEFYDKADCANFINEADASDIQIEGPEIGAI